MVIHQRFNRICPHCSLMKRRDTFAWARDPRGIPWRKVCGDCHTFAEIMIAGWRYVPLNSDEALNPEDF